MEEVAAIAVIEELAQEIISDRLVEKISNFPEGRPFVSLTTHRTPILMWTTSEYAVIVLSIILSRNTFGVVY